MSRARPSLFKLVYEPRPNLQISLRGKRARSQASLIKLASLNASIFYIILYAVLIN
ncbi:hypothetical protein HanRHA438_Chr10g0475311 [Helianthus annuus]|nr:hypothetical protein HanRHA438_Chr10g0475311 [Helianthus annuus]